MLDPTTRSNPVCASTRPDNDRAGSDTTVMHDRIRTRFLQQSFRYLGADLTPGEIRSMLNSIEAIPLN